MKCIHIGCGDETKPQRGRSRITSKTVFCCEHCGGVLPRPSEQRGRKPRNNNRRK